MLTLLRNVDCFAPEPLGLRDVLITGDRIAALEAPGALNGAGLPIVEIDAGGRRGVPGFIDPLTHPAGGGGEGGFHNRTGELSAEAFIRAGITAPVGALGTDSITRSLDVLYGTVMGLRAAGLQALMYSGAYRVPAPTLTGDLTRDLVLIEPVIGVGEVAISDHRGSQPTIDELARLAADVALGGTLSGKGGTVFVHVGDGPGGLDPLEAVLNSSDLPAPLFLPTHVNRSRALLVQAAAFTRRGGFADITVSTTPELVAAGDIPALQALEDALADGADPRRLTFSTDAGGSLPRYVDGVLEGLTQATPDVFLPLLATAAQDSDARFAQVLAGMTCNSAEALGLARQGRLAPGMSADLVLLDDSLTAPTHVICRGRALFGDAVSAANTP